MIGSGIAPECYSTPNIAAVNMGPRYSSDGATQYLIRQGVKKIVLDQSNVPGTGYIEEGPRLIAKDAGVDFQGLKDNVPIQDANSVALKAVQAAGDNGGVVLNFTPPEALKILQAAERQGLANKVKWGCSTACRWTSSSAPGSPPVCEPPSPPATCPTSSRPSRPSRGG
jgi:branched-chain amino acid transport system substrate-binding protein